MFSNKELRSMIITLFFEQLLVMLVGTFVVSSCGEAAVSGVSLVNQFNTIFIYLFTALASGGAIVVSQYIGNKDEKRTILSSSQLLMFSIVFSIILSILVLIFNKQLLGLLFGKVESDVMKACVTYLRISAYSYPALAIYNAGAALYRSMAKTKYYQRCRKYHWCLCFKSRSCRGCVSFTYFTCFFSNHYHSFMF